MAAIRLGALLQLPSWFVRGVIATCLGSTLGCSGEEEAPVEPKQSFTWAILADTHITESTERKARLERAVAWLNEQGSAEQIELVFVVGDVGWGTGLATAKSVLDELTIPYVPLIGDNEIHEGDDETYANVFGPQYAALSQTLAQWRQAPSPVNDPVSGNHAWFQNAAFQHRGVSFFAVDWCSREGGLAGELGEVHDFPEGTLPWLERELAAGEHARQGIVLFSHIPMVPLLFDDSELAKFDAVLAPYGDEIYANFAGHIHANRESSQTSWKVYTTDDLFDDELTIRLVHSRGNHTGFEQSTELIELPWP